MRNDIQRDVRLDRPHRTSGTSSVTRIGSTQQGQGRTGQRMQDFGRQREETSA